MTPRHLALVGATASGKSELALAVADAAGDAEIVSLDSMQVYRGMDVGTAKPTASERSRAPHHLIDVADPGEEWSVVRTQQLAATAIAAIEARGSRAVLVGGTGLYVAAVVYGFGVPATDAETRAALEDAVESPQGLAAAYRELAEADPVAAARIDPHNRRRVVRALEVLRATGRPFSEAGPGVHASAPPRLDVRMVGLWWPRTQLWARIAERFDHMRRAGLEAEVRRLAERPLSRTARQAIGYKELLGADRDRDGVEAAFVKAVNRTRVLARRQRVWFRRDPNVTWMRAQPEFGDLVPAVMATWGRPCSVTTEAT